MAQRRAGRMEGQMIHDFESPQLKHVSATAGPQVFFRERLTTLEFTQPKHGCLLNLGRDLKAASAAENNQGWLMS